MDTKHKIGELAYHTTYGLGTIVQITKQKSNSYHYTIRWNGIDECRTYIEEDVYTLKGWLQKKLALDQMQADKQG